MDEELRRIEREGDLAKVRAFRARHGLPVCGHDAAKRSEAPGEEEILRSTPRAACQHLIEGQATSYFQRLIGQGATCELLCQDCVEGEADAAWAVCAACLHDVVEELSWVGTDASKLVIPTREGLTLEQRTTELALLPTRPVCTVPDLGSDACRLLALTEAGTLVRLDLLNATAEEVASLPPGLSGDLVLYASADGTLLGVVEQRGQHGIVFDLEQRQTVFELDRGDYHVEHCEFPFAFFEREGRTLIVHATAWNRLDVSDPRSGELLTARELEPEGEEEGSRALDYFHCALSVSPDGAWVVEDGWVWHPVGFWRWWSLAQWLENPWESEDGPSHKSMGGRPYLWDTALCWIDATHFVVWGYGEDPDWVSAAVGVVEVGSTQVERWIHGVPHGQFHMDEHLIVCTSERTTVWDPGTGARLLDEGPSDGYHRTSRSLYRRLPDGRYRVSRLVQATS